MASNQPTPAGPLPIMKRLSPNAFLYEPPSAAPDLDPAAPDLITLFTWMAAQDAHIAKYTSRYMALYPTARILIIKCPFIHTLSSRIAKREMQPAVPVIRAVADATPKSETRPRMLLHVFSNGGSSNLTRFFDLYTAATEPRAGGRLELPPHVTIYDSCPGRFHWDRSHRALMTALPRMMSPVMHLLIAYFWFLHVPLGRPGFLGRLWAALKQKALLQSEQRRVYMYSQEDEMVYWADVEKHAAEAKEAGFKVSTELFAGSKHVAHMRLDGERYWGVVRELWDGEKEVVKPQVVKKPKVAPPPPPEIQ